MEKNNSIFITGTDTDIGKTFVSLGLCLALKKMGLKVCYFKPFQSGAVEENGQLIAPDVEELKKYNIKTKYSYLFKGDVSPHLASVIDDIEVDINKIKNDLCIVASSASGSVSRGNGFSCSLINITIFFTEENGYEIWLWCGSGRYHGKNRLF